MEAVVREGLVKEGLVNSSFWQGKRVFLTGHTGFKGAWLALWLSAMGAKVTGFALPPATTPNLYNLAEISKKITSLHGDINDFNALKAALTQAKPEIVLHLAAQALVRESYAEPLATFATNIMGTANLLEAMRGQKSLRLGVMVTTDKVYHNKEWHYPYRESDALGGHDPYSASKAACEIVIASMRDSFLKAENIAIASARAGNVIGGGDWSANRLLPDALNAWSQGQILEIRAPHATRPWQHVLEPLAGYMKLAEKLWDNPALAEAWNFGPPHEANATVAQVIDIARRIYGKGETHFGTQALALHEAGKLALETSKTRALLGLAPRFSLEAAITKTVLWHKGVEAGQSAAQLCLQDIESFMQA